MALDIRSVSGTSFQTDTNLTSTKESTSDAPSFRDSLDALQQKKLESLSFSKHAVKRMDERNIPMNDSLLGNLEHAVSEARKKGAKDVAVIGRQGVFIVNVPNNVVVTTMSEDDMKNRTVTNIDSAVFMWRMPMLTWGTDERWFTSSYKYWQKRFDEGARYQVSMDR